jgi:hypothetical protein
MLAPYRIQRWSSSNLTAELHFRKDTEYRWPLRIEPSHQFLCEMEPPPNPFFTLPL